MLHTSFSFSPVLFLFRVLIPVLVLAATGCEAVNPTAPTANGSQSHSIKPDQQPVLCSSTRFQIAGNFANARLGECEFSAANQVVLSNSPENQPINHSPWYAFKITKGQGALTATINYALHEHRYWPKISYDGVVWQRLSGDRVLTSNEGRSVTLQLDIDRTPYWVSAQEILDADWYRQWVNSMSQRLAAKKRVIGKSVAGRPLELIESNPNAARTILLVGRQHPPEVTGALGMHAYVEQLIARQLDVSGTASETSSNCDSECIFLRNTNFVIVPLLNPDGVELGHWRHGLGGIDLNRDWGPFTQPETQAIKREIDRLEDAGKEIVLFLDFHSTQKNLFYTQSVEEEIAMNNTFASRWLKRAAEQNIYPFEQQRRHNEGRPTAKNYMFERFDIPSITYEVGDETARNDIVLAAQILADISIELLSVDP